MFDSNSPKAVIDRIEGGTAVLEVIDPEVSFHMPVVVLPEGADEGSVVEFNLQLRPDIEEERREMIRDLQNELMEKPDDESDTA
ncbi:MAG: DUF3006 domain-containing protein [bacterium]